MPPVQHSGRTQLAWLVSMVALVTSFSAHAQSSGRKKPAREHPEMLENYPAQPAAAPPAPVEPEPPPAAAPSAQPPADASTAELATLAAKLSLPRPEQLVALPPGIMPWTRVTLTLQNPRNREHIDKWLPETYLGMVVLGRVHRLVGLAAAVTGVAEPRPTRAIEAMSARFVDFLAMAQIELLPLVNVWLGHMPVPADRAGLSATYFTSAWRYPGTILPSAAPLGPKTGSFAGLTGNNGVTLWGETLRGHLKYYAGQYLESLDSSPLTVGRIHVSALAPESGFFHHGNYYGSRGDILSFGLSVQYQNDGSRRVESDDRVSNAHYLGGNFDVLFEKKLGIYGVATAEAAAYMYAGRYETYNFSWYGSVSYLTPFNLYFGRLQPLVRVQQANDRVRNAVFTVVDAQLGYVVDGDNVRLALGYTRHANRVEPAHAVFLGVQLMK